MPTGYGWDTSKTPVLSLCGLGASFSNCHHLGWHLEHTVAQQVFVERMQVTDDCSMKELTVRWGRHWGKFCPVALHRVLWEPGLTLRACGEEAKEGSRSSGSLSCDPLPHLSVLHPGSFMQSELRVLPLACCHAHELTISLAVWTLVYSPHSFPTNVTAQWFKVLVAKIIFSWSLKRQVQFIYTRDKYFLYVFSVCRESNPNPALTKTG